MNESIISELFNEAVSRAELIIPDGEEYKKACDKKDKVENQLCLTFTEQQKNMFETFMEYHNEVISWGEEEAFRHGVSIGVRITAESFLLPEKTNT